LTIGGTIIEALGLGASRDAKLLVARLRPGSAAATLDEAVARALERGGHSVVDHDAELALSLALPEDNGQAFERVLELVRAVRPGGEVLLIAGDRARDAGLMLRAGLSSLRQDTDGGAVFTSGRVQDR
jgi:hypothetical protein